MGSLPRMSSMLSLGSLTAGLALVLGVTLVGFLTCVSIAGTAAVGRAIMTLGGKTVGARSDQPGTWSRATQPTTLMIGPRKVLPTDLTGTGTLSVKLITGCIPVVASGAPLHVSHTAIIA